MRDLEISRQFPAAVPICYIPIECERTNSPRLDAVACFTSLLSPHLVSLSLPLSHHIRSPSSKVNKLHLICRSRPLFCSTALMPISSLAGHDPGIGSNYMLCCTNINHMDKALLSTAVQFGIVQDLHLYDIVIVDGKPKDDLAKFSYVTMILP